MWAVGGRPLPLSECILSQLSHTSRPRYPAPAASPALQDLKCESEEEKESYAELQAQLLAAHPTHLPLLLERLQRSQKAAGGADASKGADAAQLQVSGAAVLGHLALAQVPACLSICLEAALSPHACPVSPRTPHLACRPRWLWQQMRLWPPSTRLSWQSTWRRSARRRGPAPHSARRVRHEGCWPWRGCRRILRGAVRPQI